MYILNFTSIGKKDVAIAGGKGANLGELLNAGFPVPDGFIISSNAYRDFIKANGIDTNASPETIREAVLKGNFPENAVSEILDAYASLGNNASVAVRSSATAEDLDDASFAGQQESFLNISGSDLLIEKIKACYASLWSDRAYSYRQNIGYDSAKASIAVAVQLMVEADSSGVVFTEDPSDRTRNIYINASYGLGEAVVTGIITPDEYIVDRNINLVSTVIGSKKIQMVCGENGTEPAEVEHKLRHEQALSDDEIAKLASVSLSIEKHYGCPMDIEWAFKDGDLYILQARKITSFSGSVKFEFPEVKPASPTLRGKMLFNLEKMPFVYYPLDYDFSMIIGNQRTVVFERAGKTMGGEYSLDFDGIMTFPQESEAPPLMAPPSEPPKEMCDLVTHCKNSNTAVNIINGCKAAYKDIASQDTGKFSLQQCGHAFQSLRQIISDGAFAKFMFGVLPMPIIDKTLNTLIAPTGKTFQVKDLLLGLSYKSFEVSRDMAALAANIRNIPEAAKAVIDGIKYDELVEKFPELRDDLESVLKSHGCKADFNCYCFISKSWNENKQRFLRVLIPMLQSNGSKDIVPEFSGTAYRDLLNDMMNELSHEDFEQFKAGTEAIRTSHIVREESQYLFESCFELIRRIYRRTAELLSGDKNNSDLLYLYYNEFCEVLSSGKINEAHLKLIARRKAKRPYALAYWEYQKLSLLSHGGDNIKGISGSSGIVSGKACIITDTSQFSKLQDGDILVCSYTAPEWTPLFTLAVGVVLDTGGALSHAAIVAREYKIPAVLGTGNATELIKDGDMILVNGMTGEVTKMNK